MEVQVPVLAIFAAVKHLKAEDAAETGLKHGAGDLLEGRVLAAGVR
jgi:hypothetical protein